MRTDVYACSGQELGLSDDVHDGNDYDDFDYHLTLHKWLVERKERGAKKHTLLKNWHLYTYAAVICMHMFAF
jgi:hypothetical protein